ncbi:MAG: hypothetical protein M5R42_01445 [Rhodocyclaceae bacterium]|nr:hypothetical protein [Rhodocyclaceae bacterium]
MKQLDVTDPHSRDSAGLTYVYPVVSRRAGGVSIGINPNPNNASVIGAASIARCPI